MDFFQNLNFSSSNEDGETELAEWVQAETDRPFDLRTGPVLRLALLERSTDHVLLLTMLKDPAERLHYAEQAVSGGWSRSTLEANIRDRRKQLATM